MNTNTQVGPGKKKKERKKEWGLQVQSGISDKQDKNEAMTTEIFFTLCISSIYKQTEKTDGTGKGSTKVA